MRLRLLAAAPALPLQALSARAVERYNRPRRMIKSSTTAKRVHQFKVELQGISPPIWRRIQVPEKYDFWALHVAIQDAMGWLDYHLHVFRIKPKHKQKVLEIGIPNEDGFEEESLILPGWEVQIETTLWEVGSIFEYEYDFGDGWVHDVTHEGVLVQEPGAAYPRCIGGARACPPEDCGGLGGYEGLLEILADPGHEDHEQMKEWAGEDYDPERFDPAAVTFDNPRVRWRIAFLE